MQTSSRFAVAIHVLALNLLAEAEAGWMTSEQMAASVNTNPVVVRRILGSLRRAGLVESQPGPGGGWRLLRRPEQMTLLEVYRAVDGDRGLPRHHRPPNPDCVFGRHMERALDGFFREAEAAMERKLAEFTVAEVVQAILGACGHRAQQVAD